MPYLINRSFGVLRQHKTRYFRLKKDLVRRPTKATVGRPSHQTLVHHDQKSFSPDLPTNENIKIKMWFCTFFFLFSKKNSNTEASEIYQRHSSKSSNYNNGYLKDRLCEQ
ncbi:hypothetical protein NPIL_468431 [Nephila pilipes]|uniref:Uncharacterized protein n=1 Tax=Nephila pilipes TaxID=299642 RepID=A0A8X6JLY8_NEPPI|nr:hypothetical protein NPIL_468431 [Nephila pilipes]